MAHITTIMHILKVRLQIIHEAKKENIISVHRYWRTGRCPHYYEYTEQCEDHIGS